MSSTSGSRDFERFDELADEFVARYRRGERPDLQEFIDRCPELADEIRQFFPALVQVEQAEAAREAGPRPARAEVAAPPLLELGDYRVIRETGRGGMGVVYEAEQVSLGRRVALKILPRHVAHDAKTLERFRREARAGARLHHTNIVPVFEVGQHGDVTFYAMQFIQGQGLDLVIDELRDLRRGPRKDGHADATPAASPPTESGGPTVSRVARSLLDGQFDFTITADPSRPATPPIEDGASPLPPGDVANLPGATPISAVTGGTVRCNRYIQAVARIGQQAAGALAYAHSRGIVHRDIKPSNLLLDTAGVVWITDFGLAKTDDQALTATGDILGTLRYMAPERFRGEGDARADVYALGLTLYELLTLEPAYGKTDRLHLIERIKHEEPIRPRVLDPRIPRDLETVVLKAIEKDPRRRYASAKDMAEDLRRFLDDEPIAARRSTAVERYARWARRNPGIAVLGAVLTAVLVLVTIGSVLAADRFARLARSRGEAARDAENAREAEANRAEGERLATQKALAAALAEKKAKETAEAAQEAGRKLLYTTDMRLAPFLWKDDRNTAEHLRELLRQHLPGRTAAGTPDFSAAAAKPDLRGFEWYYYQHLLDHGATVFTGHGAMVVDAAFASDAQLLVTLDQNGQVRRWDLGSQAEDDAYRRELLDGQSAQVGALSPNGRLAALAQDNIIHVFETATGKQTFQLRSASSQFRRLTFAGDGDWLVVVDDRIRWCDSSSGAVIASLDRSFDRVQSCALSADGRTLAVVGHSPGGTLLSCFRLDTTKRRVTPLATDVSSEPRGTRAASALSPDGRLVAVGSAVRGELGVHDTATGRQIAQCPAHAAPVWAIAFSGDGAKLATADDQGTIRIWADARAITPTSVALATLRGHGRAIRTLRFSNDGKRLASGSNDMTARAWDPENAPGAIQPLERRTSSRAARFSPDGLLIAAAAGRAASVWDATTGRLVRELSAGDSAPVLSVAFSPTDHRLLAVGHGGPAGASHVALWDIDAGRELARLPGAADLPDFPQDGVADAVGALAFSPDGKYLVAGFGSRGISRDAPSPSPLKVWEVATRRLLHRLDGHTGFCASLQFSSDGGLLASGSHDGTVILWSTKTWKRARTLQDPDKDPRTFRLISVRDVAFAPDAGSLAMANSYGNLHLWDVATGTLLGTLHGYTYSAEAVVFSPDGRTLASGSRDGLVRLWNVATRRELMNLDPGRLGLGVVAALGFSPDGEQLLVADLTGGSTGFWSVAPSLWNDPTRAAPKLRRLLQSNADFRSRIRMFSESVRLHEALEELDASDVRVQAALAATQANWHASRQAWPEAVAAFDRLMAADPTEPEAWLRTPGLLRLATALLHQDRPADAVRLLQGGAVRRTQDGLPTISSVIGFGVKYVIDDGAVRVTKLEADSPAARSTLKVGDVIVKGNGVAMTKETIPDLEKMLAGDVGTKLRLIVRHPGGTQSQDVELVKETYRVDDATGALFFPLLAVLEKRLADDPRSAGLLELRAELDRQEVNFSRQAADYTAAIDVRAFETAGAGSVPLRHLYRRRSDAYFQLQKWQEAVAGYDHVIMPETADADLLAHRARAHEALRHWADAVADWSRAAPLSPEGARWLADFARRLAASGQGPLAAGPYEKAQTLYEQALAADPGNDQLAVELAELLLDREESAYAALWTVLKPMEMKSESGAKLELQKDGSIFAHQHQPTNDDIYSLVFSTELKGIARLRLEVLADSRLPRGGPGWGENGNFWLNEVTLEAAPAESPDRAKAIPLRNAWADFSQVDSGGRGVQGAVDGDVRGAVDGKAGTGWAIFPKLKQDHTAVFELAEEIGGGQTRLTVRLNHLSVNQNRNLGNLGRFRLSVGGALPDPARQHNRFAAAKLTNLWARLAAAYHVIGKPQAVERVIEQHPAAASAIGDLYAADQDWERAITAYRKVLTDQPADGNVLARLAGACIAAGRTREAVLHLATASSAIPTDTVLSLKVAALEAWFGQPGELAATRGRILALARGSGDLSVVARAARACSLLPSPDKRELEAALALGRKAAALGPSQARTLLILGMAEFRVGNDAAAEKALLAAAVANRGTTIVTGISSFYRAMSLFRLGKTTEARALARDAAARMKPLPADEQNPLAGGADVDDLILWLAYKEARALIHFDASPATPAPRDGK